MVKAKKSKKADAVYAKKANATENPFALAQPATAGRKMNPFEVHVNREKFHIMGRTCKHDKGLPGVSRGKAVKRRKETLGEEFFQKHKTNQFKDRRIGRHLAASELTEEVMNARYMADKMAQVKQNKSSRFNLNDDEVLTHRGQTLEEIQNFRDDRSDDEDSVDERLNAEFTEAAHFGGDSEAQAKDRQTAIDDMIVQQKKRKLEIAKEKDEVHDLTEQLDTNYKDIIGLVGKMTKNELKAAKPPPDDYDKIMREMVFEPRGVVTDKLQSVEEVAKKEKERLEKLENERLRRMRADDELDEVADKAQPKHRSADDLDDGYFANDDGGDEDDGCLAYNLDGELGTNLSASIQQNENDNGEGDKEVEDAAEDEDDDEDDDDDEEDSASDEDDLSDLKVTDSETENEDEAETFPNASISSKKGNVQCSDKSSTKTSTMPKTALPFTIELPSSYKEFHKLISKHSPVDQGVIVERIIKCNHPKLDGVNREIVVKLFTFLLQYVNELFAEASQEDVTLHFQILEHLSPHLYDLVQLNGERMSATLLSVLKEKYAEYQKHSKRYPGLETVVFLKLVANWYSTSDFRHPVVTPCYIFIQHILSRAQVRTRQDVAIGLLLSTVCLEYGQLAKRYLPAVFNYLLGILYMSIPKTAVDTMRIVPPFESTGLLSKLLAIGESKDATTTINDDQKEEEEAGLMKSEDLVLTSCSVAFKIRAVNCALRLVTDAVSNLEDVVGSCYFAQTFVDLFKRLKFKHYPEYVRKSYKEARTVLQRVAAQKLTKLVPPAKKPKALRLLEPRIETVYDDKRRPKLTKEKEEKVKLMHKVKRETKGAVREIRRDTEYLQKIRIQQQIQSDLERKEKVKRIYQEASVQQGELNELARAKKKKKF